MNLIKNYFYPLVIGILIIIIIFLRSCSPSNPCPEGKVITVTKVDTVYKTIQNTVTIHKPSPTRIDTVYINKKIHVDTLAILKDYFAKVHYDYVIPIDTFGVVKVSEVISQNRIEDRTITSNIKIPTITKIITNTVYPPIRNKVFVGFNGGANITIPYNSSFGPSFTLLNKKEQMYDLGLGLSPAGTTINFGMKWKIKL